jgi:hypothetical protein
MAFQEGIPKMPTAKGLLKKGDQIRHKESGQVLIVLTRDGNARASYSVKVRKPDGSKFLSTGQDTFTIFGADWFLNESGRWELVEA